MIRNIIFDLGNVLLNFKPEEFLLKFHEDKEYIRNFISKVISSNTWLRLDRGTISIETAKNDFVEKYPDEKEFLIFFFNCWMEMLNPIEENVNILHELKSEGYKVYALSNYIKEAFDFVTAQYKFFSLLDGKIISCKIKAIKPEPKIYHALLDKYKLNPEECIFVDDVRSFLSYPKKLKMKTIWFQPTTDLRAELRNFGIII